LQQEEVLRTDMNYSGNRLFFTLVLHSTKAGCMHNALSEESRYLLEYKNEYIPKLYPIGFVKFDGREYYFRNKVYKVRMVTHLNI
jgi:hypothetical protein